MKTISKEELKYFFPEIGEKVFILTEKEIKILQERSPLSGLPGNIEIKKEIEANFINGPDDNIITYFDLIGFKSYNDNYGFIRGDEVLKTIAGKFKELNDGFSGHIGGDDFVGIMKESDFDQFARELLGFLENKLRDFYDAIDYERKCIISFDRQGNRNSFSLMGGILIAFKNEGKFPTPESVGEYAAQLKNIANLKTGYFIGNSVVFKSSGDDITPLKSVITDKKIPLNNRRGIIESLGELKDFSYESTILEVLNSEDVEILIKKSALYALGKLRIKETVPEIKKYIRHNSAHLRMRAVEALGEIGLPDTDILDAFTDRNYYVRQAAILAAGRTNEPKFIPALKKQLADKSLYNYAIISLASLGDEDIISDLASFVNSGVTQTDIRIKALKILADNEKHLNPQDIFKILNNIQNEPPDYVVEALLVAAKIIAYTPKILNSHEYQKLFELSEHSSWRVRRAVCEFASRSNRNEALMVIKKLCYDANMGVQVKAIKSLAAFPDKYFYVTKFFNNPHTTLRSAAVSAITYMDIPPHKIPNIIEKLRLLLKDPSHEVAENAAKSAILLLTKQ